MQLNPSVNKEGYLYLNLSKDSILKTYKVHRLIAITFLPNPDNKPQINHKNGVKSDNSVGNLEWVTGSENLKHAYDTGLQKKGEANWRAKLTDKQVEEIRNSKEGNKALGAKYGVNKATIFKLRANRYRLAI